MLTQKSSNEARQSRWAAVFNGPPADSKEADFVLVAKEPVWQPFRCAPVRCSLVLALLILRTLSAATEEISGSFISAGGDSFSATYLSQGGLDADIGDGEGTGGPFLNRGGFYPTVNHAPFPTQTRFLLPSFNAASATFSYSDLVNRFSPREPDGDPITFTINANAGSLLQNGRSGTVGSLSPGQSMTWFAPTGIYGANIVLTVTPSDGVESSAVEGGFYRTFAPVILRDPIGGTFAGALPLDIDVVAIGLEPLSYQWTKDSTIRIVWGTNSVLNLTNVGRIYIGTYSVTVSNALGSVKSAIADIEIVVPEKVDPPKIIPGGGVQLKFGDFDGTPLSPADITVYHVFWSTNLIDWTELDRSSFVLNNGKVELVDPAIASLRRFYKVTTDKK